MRLNIEISKTAAFLANEHHSVSNAFCITFFAIYSFTQNAYVNRMTENLTSRKILNQNVSLIIS